MFDFLTFFKELEISCLSELPVTPSSVFRLFTWSEFPNQLGEFNVTKVIKTSQRLDLQQLLKRRQSFDRFSVSEAAAGFYLLLSSQVGENALLVGCRVMTWL